MPIPHDSCTSKLESRRHKIIPADLSSYRIPDTMSYATGALIEPLSVAYNAVVRAKPYLGQPVVICGAGPIGLAMALCARAAGASPIVITDLEQNRLEQAHALGFNRTLKIDLSWDRLATAAKIREVMGTSCLPQIAFECTGAASSINAACYVSDCPLDPTVLSPLTRMECRLSRMEELCFKSAAASQESSFRSCRWDSERSTLSLPSDTNNRGPWSSVWSTKGSSVVSTG